MDLAASVSYKIFLFVQDKGKKNYYEPGCRISIKHRCVALLYVLFAMQLLNICYGLLFSMVLIKPLISFNLSSGIFLNASDMFFISSGFF